MLRAEAPPDTRGGMGDHPASCAFSRAPRAHLRLALLLLASSFSATGSLAQSAPSGSAIRNVADISYDALGQSRLLRSNEVVLTVVPAPSRSVVTVARLAQEGANGARTSTAGPTQCLAGGAASVLDPPYVSGAGNLDAAGPLPLVETAYSHGGDAVFVRVEDADQNRDSAALETVEVRVSARATGDVEMIRLTETGADTGVFVGYIPSQLASAASGNCRLDVERDSLIDVSYVDPRDSADRALGSSLVDPFGLVFDSRSGAPVNGARVRLISVATGLPAVVYGDDGVSRHPAEVITGQAVTDASGRLYTYPAGIYRFPLVAPGTYRLEIEPPATHLFASSASIAELQSLPGAPFRLSGASFGGNFDPVDPVAAVIDVPLDPAAESLALRKSAGVQLAAVGDFVEYRLVLDNNSTQGAARGLRLIDVLPTGMRYRSGSARLDGRAGVEPQIGADGRTLTFGIAGLAAGTSLSLRYVAEVTVGARGLALANVARAVTDNGLHSNEARAIVRVTRELFTDRGFIVGRVMEGACDDGAAAAAGKGVAGLRIYLEDGRYALTDEEGKYHFEGVEAGSHVVQIDLDSLPSYLELAPCAAAVRRAGRSYSQFVELRAGALWRADFALQERKPASGDLRLTLRTTPRDADTVLHRALVQAQGVPARVPRLIAMLPQGYMLEPDTVRLGGEITRDYSLADGVLSVRLGELAAGAEQSVEFATRAALSSAGDRALKVYVQFDSPAARGRRTEIVENLFGRPAAPIERASYTFSPRFDVLRTELKSTDRAALDAIVAHWSGVRDIRALIVGHADKTPVGKRNQKLYPDNYALSKARAAVIAAYLVDRLDVSPSQLRVEGRGSDAPLAPGSDAASLALNRRVEIALEGEREVTPGAVEVRLAQSPVATIATQDIVRRPAVPIKDRPANASAPAAVGVRGASVSAERRAVTELDVESLAEGIALLAPLEGANPQIPNIKVAIAHLPAQSVVLRVNGEAVSALSFDGVAVNGARTVALSRWRGIELRDGANELVAEVRDAQGAIVQSLERVVHYGGGAVRAEIDRVQSRLTADGKQRPLIALRLFDAYGKPARPGTLGAFRVDPPYRSWWEVEALDDNPLLSSGAREPTFTVDPDGLARLELEPTTQAGFAQIQLRFNERQSQQVRVWLAPAARDWIMVGIASGTATHRSITRNLEPAPGEESAEEGLDEQGRIAFFAKGRVRGDWLLTAAYDSTRDPRAARERLKGVIEPDRYYLVYGDGTEQRFEAASTERVFLKLERREFVALFGDFDTGFTVTELTRYSRSLTGLKAEYAGQRGSLGAFAARSDLGFGRDELQGDGTSGLYHLSRRPLVINSDKVRIEVRDRFRSENVLESRELVRFLDYRIDYEAGTLFFKEPVASRDAAFNPVFIVAEYETPGRGDEQTSAGARAAVAVAGGQAEIALSALLDGNANGDTRIVGADLKWQLAPRTKLRAELAQSRSDDPSRADSALAYLAEVEHVTQRLETRAYLREQESGFGAGQQNASEGGTRKAGFDARWKFSDHWSLRSELLRQQQLDSGAERELASAELHYQQTQGNAAAGVRHASDDAPDGSRRDSEQLFMTASHDFWERRLTLRASGDLGLGGGSDDESVDYPARALLGIDYRLRRNVTAFAEWEHAEGAQLASDMTRVGLRAEPWERTRIVTSVNQRVSEYGPRTFANVGLTQGWRLNERWLLDYGIDQSNTLRGVGLVPQNPLVPLASGSTNEDFFASFVGAQYQADGWTLTSRAEHRSADSEDRWAFTSGWYREPAQGHALSMSLQWFSTDSRAGADISAGDLRFSWAWRPASSRWIVFDRIDLKRDTSRDLSSSVESLRFVNNLHANWQLDPHSQLGLQVGARHVRSTFDGVSYRGLSTIGAFDLRRDLGWRPAGRALDFAVHGAALNSWQSGVAEYSFGFDVGVTVATNVWLSAGYNLVGFHDDDFSAARQTEKGPFIRLRIKADQDTFKDLRLDSLRPAR